MPRSKVAIIFDLDETIGHFWQIGKLWEALKFFEEKKFNEKDFNKILDMFPYVFRPEIFKIFKYLKKVKDNDKNVKVIIYSNNMGTPKWANMIKKYIEKKVGGKLFDKVITAWKVDGKIYQKCRTTNDKTYKDIIKCGNLNKNTEIFFVDDTMYPKMMNKKVDFMHIKEYLFSYNIENMVYDFLNSKITNKLSKKSKFELKHKLATYIRRLNWGDAKYRNGKTPNKVDIVESKKLFVNIKNFLKEKNKKSRSKKKRKSGTRRIN